MQTLLDNWSPCGNQNWSILNTKQAFCYAMEGVRNLIFLFSGNRLCYAIIMIPVHLHDELRIQERKKSGMCSMCGGNHGK